MPLVTVIIPAYNVEKFLEDSARSVLAQTYPDLELIIVDDASPDGTGTLADQLATTDERIRVIHHTENKRRAGALNTGIREARGKYISFLDADDWYHTDKTEHQVAFLESHPDVDLVYGDYEYLKIGDDTPRKLFGAKTLEGARDRLVAAAQGGTTEKIIAGYIPSCSPLIRKEVFEKVHFDESMRNMEDLDIWLQILGGGFTGIHVPVSTYIYRHHENQKSRDSEKAKLAAERIKEKIVSGTYLT